MRSSLQKFLVGSSIAAMAVGFHGEAAFAQPIVPAGDDQQVEQVVVTGSSIKGAAPVGSNLIAVDAQELKATGAVSITQALSSIPALSFAGGPGRGGTNGTAGASVYIHNLGTTLQNSTLVLLDGNRMPYSGRYIVDPNDFPQIMLQRVDVLAEGASATYGSDAVAGVVNFVTRQKFDGLELSLRGEQVHGMAMGKLGQILVGKNWNTGNVTAAFDYSFEGALPYTALPKTNPLVQTQRALDAGFTAAQISAAKTNFGNFNCNPATIRLNGTGNYYLSAQSATNIVGTAANSPCSQWAYSEYLPSEARQHAMIKASQELAPGLTLSTDLIYSNRESKAKASRGILNATAFGPSYNGGAQSMVAVTQNGATTATTFTQQNPFYTDPPGRTSATQSVSYDFNQLFGPGATSNTGDQVLMGNVDLDWQISDEWDVDFHAGAGRSQEFFKTFGVVNQASALLALNGTAISNGNASTTPVPGTNTVVVQSLTTSNALDVWNPVGTNRTSAATLANLISTPSTATNQYFTNAVQQFRAVANGSLWDLLGAGRVKVAFGAEFVPSSLQYFNSSPGGAGPNNISTGYTSYDMHRNVASGFLELGVPVVAPSQNVPFVRKLDINLSGRIDQYSDVGGTENPKVSVSWEVDWGLKLRANWSTSFVAPPLAAIGDPSQHYNTVFSSVVASAPGFSAPVAAYPNILNFGIAGCTATSVSCSLPGTARGLTITSVDPNNRPQKGHGYVLGFDFNPDVLPGFTSSFSWWRISFIGGITAGTPQISATSASLQNRIQLFPSCATPAQISAAIGHVPVQSTIPACVSFTVLQQNNNTLNFWSSGVDGDINYAFDTDYGAVSLGTSFSLMTTNKIGYANGVLPPVNQRFSILGTTGLTNSPSTPLQARTHLGWSPGPWQADIYLNYTSHYRSMSSPIIPEGFTNGNYNGTGGDPVPSQVTMDVRLGYTFESGILDNDTLSVSARNLLNQYPPYVNGSTGFDNLPAGAPVNPMGRMLTVGLDVRL